MDLVTLYTYVDDFFKEIQQLEIWEELLSIWQGKRGPKKKQSISETVTLNILRFTLRVKDLKTFHHLIVDRYSAEFSRIPNYENFLKATNKSSAFTQVFLKYLLYINKMTSSGQNHFIDSTPLTVCYNHNIYKHKVTKGLAQRGKSTKGWFYGFKLHGVCNERGELENIFFTPGNVHDNQTIEGLVSDLCGTVTADAGYLVKEDVFFRIFTKTRKVYIATRKNMKRIMTKKQSDLFKSRSRIETTWGVLKERFCIIFHMGRSPQGLFRHYFYSIVSFLLYNKESYLLGMK